MRIHRSTVQSRQTNTLVSFFFTAKRINFRVDADHFPRDVARLREIRVPSDEQNGTVDGYHTPGRNVAARQADRPRGL